LFYAAPKDMLGNPGTYTRQNGTTKTWTKQATAATNTTTPAAAGTAGLAFTLINNNKEYSVSKGKVEDGAVVIPATYNNLPVTTIEDFAFQYKAIDSVTIPNSITSIGTQAFQNCAALTSITIPNSVKSIGNGAFTNCTELKNITIPNSVTIIMVNAFSGCKGLTSATIGSGVTKIESNIFGSCTSLTSVTFAGTIPSANVDQKAFPGDLRDKFYATDKTKGTAGTYTRADGKAATPWIKK